jgi:hypothetical protein
VTQPPRSIIERFPKRLPQERHTGTGAAGRQQLGQLARFSAAKNSFQKESGPLDGDA